MQRFEGRASGARHRGQEGLMLEQGVQVCSAGGTGAGLGRLRGERIQTVGTHAVGIAINCCCTAHFCQSGRTALWHRVSNVVSRKVGWRICRAGVRWGFWMMAINEDRMNRVGPFSDPILTRSRCGS